MDASAKSLIAYGSFKLKDKAFIESAVALGKMEIDLARSVDGGQNKGLRTGKQLYGSFTYLFEPEEELLIENRNINYFSRLDIGFTELDDYTESGDDDAVFYDDQLVKSATLSLGFNYSGMINLEKAALTPLFKFELGKSKTINSLSEAYYINDASTIYANAMADQNTFHGHLTLGLGASFENNLNFNISFDHYRNNKALKTLGYTGKVIKEGSSSDRGNTLLTGVQTQGDRDAMNEIAPDAPFITTGTTKPDSVAAKFFGNTANKFKFSFENEYAAAKARQKTLLGSPSSVGLLAVNQSPFYNWLKDKSLNKGIL